MPRKDKQCSIPINLWRVKKLLLYKKKRSYNPESFQCNHKKFGTQSETSLLVNCGKILVCHPKNGGILGQKVAVEKHRFSTSK